jgi:uncharacterized membrane protein
MHRALLSAVLSLSVLLSTFVAAQDASYTFTTIDVPGAEYTEAHEIDDSGRIVGMFYDGTRRHGFLMDGATFTTIDVPGAEHTEAYGINDNGRIVGAFYDGIRWYGFLMDGATFTSIDFPDNVPGETVAGGINTAGLIVGWSAIGPRGFLTNGTTFTPIGPPGANGSLAHGINTAGQVVGAFSDGTKYRGFLKDGDTYTPINVPDTARTEAYGINAVGQIVGTSHDAITADYGGFLTNGVTFTLIAVPGAHSTFAYGINAASQIVGAFQNTTGALDVHGFVATPDGVDTSPPVITVSASPAILSPPNGRLVTVTVSGTITDGSGGSGVQASTYQIVDEYGQIQPSGSVPPSSDGRYAFTVELQASRRGNDQNGRQYRIAVSATDNAGNPAGASTIATVPRK